MEIFIRNNSSIPIYAQITDQIRSKILSGDLLPDEMLPSIRLLAKELCISAVSYTHLDVYKRQGSAAPPAPASAATVPGSLPKPGSESAGQPL